MTFKNLFAFKRLFVLCMFAFSWASAWTSSSFADQPETRKPVIAQPWHYPKVVYWRGINLSGQPWNGVRYSGEVTATRSELAADGSYHVFIDVRKDEGATADEPKEMSFEFWDKRGYNPGLASHLDLLGKRVNVLLTIKYYSLNEET